MPCIDIVGYITNDLSNNYSIVSCPFTSVDGKEEVPLQSLIPVGSNGKTKSGAFAIQEKLPGGKIGKTYSYCLDNEFDDYCPEGWYWDDGDGISARTDKTFKPGEGIMFKNSGSANGHLTYSGEVVLRDIEMDLTVTYNTLGNPRATAINLQNLIPVTSEGKTAGNGAFQMQEKLPGGRIGKTYSYCLNNEFDDYCPEGWYWDDGDGASAREDRMINPSEGFFFKTNKTGSKLTLQKQSL